MATPEGAAPGAVMPEAGAVTGNCPSRTYLTLLSCTVLANAVVFAFTGVSRGVDRFFWFALVNVVVAVLVRNELFLNCLYVVLVSSFRSPRLPVGMKNCVTSGLLYIGGI